MPFHASGDPLATYNSPTSVTQYLSQDNKIYTVSHPGSITVPTEYAFDVPGDCHYFALGLSSDAFYIDSIEATCDLTEGYASNWATDFLYETDCICQSDGSTNYIALASLWSDLSGTYNNMSAAAKAWLIDPATAHNATYRFTIQSAVARYNYIVGKYGALSAFISGGGGSGSQKPTMFAHENNNLIVALGLFVTISGALAAFAVARKKRQA